MLLATLSIPIMMRQNYSKELASGVVAAAGTLGILIPPSIMLVIMADQLSISVGDLFMGAVIPGVMLGFFYLVYVIVLGLVRPDMAPAPPQAEPLTGREIWVAIMATVPTAALIIAVLGTIFFGFATPSEASGVGAFGATLARAVQQAAQSAGDPAGRHRDRADHRLHLRHFPRRHRLRAGDALARRRRVHRAIS